ncbi:hypothetical protein XMG59_001584 [Marinobacterium sp. xm-g-59]|uniref:hypothetical protein n=1 Tax=Marinobacterium sp. xm-g-59 TaxID=2497748 RepID=UPI0015684AC3|nr:hypothetical protein [Marinobacterium sp. xm-g-59]NRP95480.1 hypothetical protein [Marinobacterium sp. xm-g-59]
MISSDKIKDYYNILAYPSIIFVIKSLAALLTLKIVAQYLGAAGILLYGVYIYISQIVNGLSVLGLQNFTVHEVALQNKDNIERHISQAYTIMLFFFLIICIGISISDVFLEMSSLENEGLVTLYWCAAMSLTYALAMVLNSLVTGLGHSKTVYRMSLVNSLSILVSVSFGAIMYGKDGAMIGFSFSSAMYLVVNYLQLGVDERRYLLQLPRLPTLSWMLNYKNYVLIGLFSITLLPLFNIYIRLYVSDNFGVEYAGYQEAMVRISVLYTAIAASILSVYFMPRFSRVRTKENFLNEMIYSISFMGLCFLIGGTILYSLKYFFVKLILGESFQFIESIIGYYIIGDFFRSIGLCITYYILVKGKWKIYIVSEFAALVVFGILYLNFVSWDVVLALGLPYVFGSLFYMVVMLCIAALFYGRDMFT